MSCNLPPVRGIYVRDSSRLPGSLFSVRQDLLLSSLGCSMEPRWPMKVHYEHYVFKALVLFLDPRVVSSYGPSAKNSGHFPSLKPGCQITRLALEVTPVAVKPLLESIIVTINLGGSLGHTDLSNSYTTFLFFFTLCRPVFNLLIH